MFHCDVPDTAMVQEDTPQELDCQQDDASETSSPMATAEHIATAEDPPLGSPQNSIAAPPILEELAGARIFLDICSGSGHPLTTSFLRKKCICVSVDKLICSSMDLLDNIFFDSLLRLCSSGIVGYGAAAPNCGDYSRLKLRPGGPRAIRTPTQLDGVPNLSAEERERIQVSHELVCRCILCLELIFSAGGHIHIEQPTNSMAWLEPIMQHLIKFAATYLVYFPACAFDRDWQKSWLLACSYPGLKPLGRICQHPPDSHEAIAGVRFSDGTFKSRITAEYPPAMCDAISDVVSPLLSQHGPLQLSVLSAAGLIPQKGLHDLPVSH